MQFLLFLGVDMDIGILLSRQSGIRNRLLAAPVTLATVLPAHAASAARLSFTLLCVGFALQFAVLAIAKFRRDQR